ncbi:TPA: hypothetical protein ACVU5O_003257 [Vibrio parahaemolyticus]
MSIQTFTEPCHLPCPDLPHYSLTKEDKERGLRYELSLKQNEQQQKQSVSDAKEFGSRNKSKSLCVYLID